MPDRLVYRVTERDAELIRVTENGELQRILERGVYVPPPPPDWLQEVIRVRRNIGDPATADFIYAETLPPAAPPNTAFTAGDGVYWYFADGTWKRYFIRFSDLYIRQLIDERGRLRASVRLVDDLIARIDPLDYITSGNAGGQSVSFLTLADILAYYNALRDRLLAEEADAEGMNSGLMLKTVRRPVGGVLEYY
jgi:hypothetical protein